MPAGILDRTSSRLLFMAEVTAGNTAFEPTNDCTEPVHRLLILPSSETEKTETIYSYFMLGLIKPSTMFVLHLWGMSTFGMACCISWIPQERFDRNHHKVGTLMPRTKLHKISSLTWVYHYLEITPFSGNVPHFVMEGPPAKRYGCCSMLEWFGWRGNTWSLCRKLQRQDVTSGKSSAVLTKQCKKSHVRGDNGHPKRMPCHSPRSRKAETVCLRKKIIFFQRESQQTGTN